MKREKEIKEKNIRKAKRYILGNVIFVPFIPFVLVVAVFFYYFLTALEQKTLDGMKRVVEDHKEMIETFLSERKSDLEFVTDTFAFSDLKQAAFLENVFQSLKGKSNAFVDLGVFNSKGDHLSYIGPYALTGKNYGSAKWFQNVTLAGSYISDVFMGYRNVPHFVVALSKQENRDFWVIRATIDTQFFNSLVSRIRMGKTGEAYLINAKGILQTTQHAGLEMTEKIFDEDIASMNYQGVQTFSGLDSKNKKYIYATTVLSVKDWKLVVCQEKKDAYQLLYKAVMISILIACVGGLGIIFMAFYMTERIVREIEHLDSEKKDLSRQLIRATQLAELGETAAGFAHEINNPLQIINSEYALIKEMILELEKEGLVRESEELSELVDSVDQIKIQVNRCSSITKAILRFSRQNISDLQEIDPATTIPQIIELIAQKATVNGVEIEQRISDSVPRFMGDQAQFQQVMLNLLNNAMDAVLEKHASQGGFISVKARKGEEGKTVEITISDNGMGIRPENMEKIFTPFFTTKPVGKGTGLGLSICYGIVGQMGGSMSFKSEPGKYTAFCLTLPVNSV